MIELINRVRLDPSAEAARLGIDLNEGIDGARISGKSYQPLALNDRLSDAAAAHSEWMLANERFSHKGAQGSVAGDRILAAGLNLVNVGTWSENISLRASSGVLNQTNAILAQHDALFNSPLHRLNIFRADAREVGVGQTLGDFDGYDASLITQNFVSNKRMAYLTGVAYVDRDGDDFYSVGEGRAGIGIRVAGHAGATAAAGGYQIAFNDRGTQVIHAETGAGKMSLKINFKGGNVKLDLIGDREVAASGDLTLLAGLNAGTLLGTNNLSLTGNGRSNALHGNSGNNLIKGGAGGDQIKGGLGHDVLLGQIGRDMLSGGAGRDTLKGGSGDDTLMGGQGADRMIGNEGFDTANYSQAPSGVHVSLTHGKGQGGEATGDVLIKIEGLIGSTFDDVLIGGTGRNFINGLDGDDFLNGGTGRDTLTGGAGDDTLIGDHGPDRIDGGTGYDTVDYSAAQSGVTIFLDGRASQGGVANGDLIQQVEAVVGSGFADSIFGNASDNLLTGLGGADRLFGDTGIDTLVGGEGSDELHGGIGSDTFIFAANSGHDKIVDFEVGVDQIYLSADQVGTDGLAGLIVTEDLDNTILTLADGATITLIDVVALSDLAAVVHII